MSKRYYQLWMKSNIEPICKPASHPSDNPKKDTDIATLVVILSLLVYMLGLCALWLFYHPSII